MTTTMRLNSMADYEALKNRDVRKIVPCCLSTPQNQDIDRVRKVFLEAKKPNPRGQHKPGVMNKSEQAFSMHLDIRKQGGEVKDWKFEAIKLKLADRCTYTPDFNVEMANGDLVMVEVKAKWNGKGKCHWEDDSRVKIKVAADLFRGWFQFYGAHFDGGKWVYESF